ncbi:DUF2283 domain-containing protein [Chloroflexota bacterium]
MALSIDYREYLKFLSAVKQAPERHVWLSYDGEADVMYINFQKPSKATDSELTDDDVIMRYDGDTLIGLTILHASQRNA